MHPLQLVKWLVLRKAFNYRSLIKTEYICAAATHFGSVGSKAEQTQTVTFCLTHTRMESGHEMLVMMTATTIIIIIILFILL